MILIVDDDIVMLSILESILSSFRFPCCTAMTMADAQPQLAAAKSNTPLKAIICDHHLGDTSGFDLLMEAKSILPTVPFIIMSADTIADAEKKYPLKPDYFLPKPFTVESIQGVLNALGITHSE